MSVCFMGTHVEDPTTTPVFHTEWQMELTPLGLFSLLGRNFLFEEILNRLQLEDLAMLWETSHAWQDVLKTAGWDPVSATRVKLRTSGFVLSVARLRWALLHNLRWDATTCAAIASGGKLSVLQWARENGCPWDYMTAKRSARHGHLEVLKWAVDRGCPCCEEDISNAAARSGQLEVLKWLRSRGCEWSTETFIAAVKSGDLNTIRWLRENGCGWDENTCEVAAKYRHFEVLKWAVASGCHMFNAKEVLSFAVQGSDAEIIGWLRDRGLEYDKWTCELAAECGQLDVLMRLHKEGRPLNNTTCYFAARTGRIDILKWLWETGFQWNTDSAFGTFEGTTFESTKEDNENFEAADYSLLSRRRRLQEQQKNAQLEKSSLLAQMASIYDAQSRRDDTSNFEVFVASVKSHLRGSGDVSRVQGRMTSARDHLLEELQTQLQQVKLRLEELA